MQPDDHFYVIGIVSHENDYRLSWSLNQQFKFKFTKSDNLIISQPKLSLNQTYSVFIFEDEESFVRYSLISNKSENGFLIPDLKNIDYILKISGEIQITDVEGMVQKFKRVDLVTTAFIIDNLPTKLLKNLVF